MGRILLVLGLFHCLSALLPYSSYAETAENAYKEARDCYTSLRSDASAQRKREPWERCIAKFERVKRDFSRRPEGADAQYSLGRLFGELASNSKNPADWKRAVKEYRSFATAFPTSTMADDAYFEAAVIEWERLHDKDAAKRDLLKVIKHYRNGDKAGAASKYLKDVEAGRAPDDSTMIKEEPSKNKAQKIRSRGAERPLTIVLDPGHGGSDTGAIGPDGVEEKDLTLAISKKTASELKKRFTGARVYLTRDDDRTLTLDERVRFANRKRADYFISIHANASRHKKESGIQTYYLNNATDSAAERLAAQENRNAGRDVGDLEKIIATMIQNESTVESQELARSVHKSLIDTLSRDYSGIVDQKVRSALFYVLVGVKCPSILVETSYISNPREEKRLKTEKYQNAIAGAISAGLQRHVDVRKNDPL